jgi:hypothetical protein
MGRFAKPTELSGGGSGAFNHFAMTNGQLNPKDHKIQLPWHQTKLRSMAPLIHSFARIIYTNYSTITALPRVSPYPLVHPFHTSKSNSQTGEVPYR